MKKYQSFYDRLFYLEEIILYAIEYHHYPFDDERINAEDVKAAFYILTSTLEFTGEVIRFSPLDICIEED